MGVYNQLTTKCKSKLTSDYDTNTGMAFGGGLGSQLQGFQKTIANHPFSGVTTDLSKQEGIEQLVNTTTGALTATGLYYPRALVSRHKVLNTDFVMPIISGQIVAGG